MSVPKSLRSKSELQVLYNADELAIYSIQVCSNEKIFPKRFRWTITDRIVGSAIKVAEYIEKANALRNDNEVDAELRKRYQRAAVSELDGLTTLLRLAYRMFPLDSSRYEHWTELTMNVKTPLLAWIRSDKPLKTS